MRDVLLRWRRRAGLEEVDPDSSTAALLRRRIIQSDPALQLIYRAWARRVAEDMRTVPGPVIEVGGAGTDPLPGVSPLYRFDVVWDGSLDFVADATELPLAEASIGGIVMTNVLHHVPDVAAFFREAARCLRPGGVVSMIEPWVTSWSSLIYRRLHHEPFDPAAHEWSFPSTGPLSGANGALPWILFERDRERFFSRFPEWALGRIEPIMPLSYLLSGGVSTRPWVSARLLAWLMRREDAWPRWRRAMGLFAHITLSRRG